MHKKLCVSFPKMSWRFGDNDIALLLELSPHKDIYMKNAVLFSKFIVNFEHFFSSVSTASRQFYIAGSTS